MTYLLPGTRSVLDGVSGLHFDQFGIFFAGARVIRHRAQLRRRTDSAHPATLDGGGTASLLDVHILARWEGTGLAEALFILFAHFGHGDCELLQCLIVAWYKKLGGEWFNAT